MPQAQQIVLVHQPQHAVVSCGIDVGFRQVVRVEDRPPIEAILKIIFVDLSCLGWAGEAKLMQLVINTVTNIVSMLMVFLIQNTQNRESSALQLKIDELLRAVRGAQNIFINLEDLSEDDLNRLKVRYAAIAVRAREESNLPSMTVEPASGPGPTSPE